jgi:hypothetical protein
MISRPERPNSTTVAAEIHHLSMRGFGEVAIFKGLQFGMSLAIREGVRRARR